MEGTGWRRIPIGRRCVRDGGVSCMEERLVLEIVALDKGGGFGSLV